MLFTELRYVLFFALAFLVHWALRENRWRKRWLLLASYAFYSAWDWRFCSLIVASTVIDFNAGRMLGRDRPPGGRKLWVTISLVANLGMLGFFKYFNFFVESGQTLFAQVGLEFPVRTMGIVLPVGISFYTFQTLSYTIDVYRRHLQPVRDFWDFALFVGFFPQLVAGPIVRAVDFLPQLVDKRRFATVDFRSCLTLFLIGYIKKACISDNLAVVVDRYFAAPETYDVAAAYTAAFYYAVQVYCDFSGYSDMAIASAGLLGYRLCINFRWPFFAPDIGDFWRRWHISLSSWLRDYLYIPLGGNRGSRLFQSRNLMATLVLCGFWHGAGWNYILFGFVHAVAVIGRVTWREFVPKGNRVRRFLKSVGVPLTFWFFCGSLIIFRPLEWKPMATGLRAYLFDAQGDRNFGPTVLLLLPLLGIAHWIAYRGWLAAPWRRLPAWAAYLVLGAVTALALQWAGKDYRPFIYFQF